LYLVALFYLVWPIFFNVAGLFGKSFFYRSEYDPRVGDSDEACWFENRAGSGLT